MNQENAKNQFQISVAKEEGDKTAQLSCGQVGEMNWLSTLQQRIENGVRGFDATYLVDDCAAASKRGTNLARGLIFGSLKAAGVGPLLLCDKLP